MDQCTPTARLLSVVMPVYNELDTWRDILDRVKAVELPAGLAREIIMVDDCSTDGTRRQLEEFDRRLKNFASSSQPSVAEIRVLFHDRNRGKGAALRTGLEAAAGDIVIIQDADLEYDPSDYAKLVAPILDGEADVVYGSRFANGRPAGAYLKNYLANRFLTGFSNLLTGLALTDMETCYKVFRREISRGIHLEQDSFGFEPEVTAKLASLGVKIREVPISYNGRSRAEGKKIGWADGLKAMWCIVKYGLFSRLKRRLRGKSSL